MWFVRSGETPQLWSGATIELDDDAGTVDVADSCPPTSRWEPTACSRSTADR